MGLCLILLITGFLCLRQMLILVLHESGLVSSQCSAIILSGFIVYSLQFYATTQIYCPTCKDLLIFYTFSFILLDIFTVLHVPYIYFVISFVSAFAIMCLLKTE